MFDCTSCQNAYIHPKILPPLKDYQINFDATAETVMSFMMHTDTVG